MEERFDFASVATKTAESLMLHRGSGDLAGQARALVKLANLATNQSDFAAALDYLHEADDIARQVDDPELDREVLGYLTNVLLEMDDATEALPAARRAVELAQGGTAEERMLALNSLGCTLSLAGSHAEALDNLERAHALIPSIDTATEDRVRHYEAQSLADLSFTLLGAGLPAEALERARQGEALAAARSNDPLVQLNARYAGRAALALGEPQAALEALDRSLALARRMAIANQLARTQLDRAEALAALDRHREAYEAQCEARQVEHGFTRERASRRLEFRKAREEIEQARREAQAANRALFAVLPEPIARRIQAGEARIAEELPSVSVLFADMVGFTAMSRTVTPRAVLDRLDGVFSLFDRLTTEAGLDKIKTIGDAYMAVGGALDRAPDHPERCLRLAMRMLDELARQDVASGVATHVRIGMNVGPAIAGVIGSQRLSFDLWGDTVNFASRLESSGAAGRLHVSQAVVDLLGDKYRFEPRGKIELKGIGGVETYFLVR